jgi:multicomponent K+:H+ antiporter subunit G
MTPAELPRWLEIPISVLLIFGGFTALLGALGLVRFRSFFTRLHAPTKTSTLGIGGVLLGSMVYLSWISELAVIHQVLIAVFVFMTAPISAHQMAKAMLDANPEMRPPLPDSGLADSPRIGNTQAQASHTGQDHDQIGPASQRPAHD